MSRAVPFRVFAPLRPGDRVAVVAPAGPTTASRLEAGLAVLRRRYQVVSAPGLLARDGYLAGSDGRRLAELCWALSDPSVRAVFCTRGGYGVLRYLSQLCAVPAAERRPVPLCGFSDITVLHAWAAQGCLVSIHGPVVTQLGELPADNVAALLDLLESPAPPPPLAGLTPHFGGSARGRLLGGNIEVLSRLCGTGLADALLPGGPVLLLLEEVGERPYRIDRALTQLLLSGALRQVAGVVIGELVRCEEPDGSGPDALQVILDRLRPLAVPVVSGAPIGHGARNRAVPLGVLAELDAGVGTLRFLESASAG